MSPDAVTTRAATLPNPAAVPPPTHTVDNAGFVDNGGRTSDEVARTQLSGMRATEMGSQRLTGTPASGLPIPGLDPPTPKREPEEMPRPRVAEPSVTAGAPNASLVGRLVQAVCDHETVCGHVGPSRRWGSSAACAEGVREPVRADVDATECLDGLDAAAVSACLTTLRRASCESAPQKPSALRPCEPRTLCLSR
jgi:hypothetical protein